MGGCYTCCMDSVQLNNPDLPTSTRLLTAVRRGAVATVRKTAPLAYAQDPRWLHWAVEAALQSAPIAKTVPLLQVLMPLVDVNTATASETRDVFQVALERGRLDVLPLLHTMGYRVDKAAEKDQHAIRQQMSDALCRGQWPHPDLLDPELLVRDEGAWFERVAQGLFRVFWQDRKGKWMSSKTAARQGWRAKAISSAMTPEHLDRLLDLPLPDMAQAHTLIAQAFALTVEQQNLRMLMGDNPQWADQVKRLMRDGWLREELVQWQDPSKPTAIKGAAFLAQTRAQIMEEGTATVAVVARRASGMRL